MQLDIVAKKDRNIIRKSTVRQYTEQNSERHNRKRNKEDVQDIERSVTKHWSRESKYP